MKIHSYIRKDKLVNNLRKQVYKIISIFESNLNLIKLNNDKE
jgi:hypothetical protein